jgi:hypothetical protein
MIPGIQCTFSPLIFLAVATCHLFQEFGQGPLEGEKDHERKLPPLEKTSNNFRME